MVLTILLFWVLFTLRGLHITKNKDNSKSIVIFMRRTFTLTVAPGTR